MATTTSVRRTRFGTALGATIALWIAQGPFEDAMRSTGGPGIVGFERAGDSGVGAILAEWGAAGADAARMQLVVDFGFVIAYALALVLAARIATDSFKTAWVRRALAAGATMGVLSAIADATENVAMLRVLDGATTTWPDIARTASTVKFGLAIVAVAVCGGGLLVALAVDPQLRNRLTGSVLGSRRWLEATDTEVDPQCGRPPAIDLDARGGEQPVVAICCSGGGIRSAAFSLGGLQALTRRGIYGKAHIITAVSGGSYIASSFAMVRSASRAAPAAGLSGPGPTLLRPDLPAYAPGSPEEARLRTHARYLLPDSEVASIGVLAIFWGLIVNLGALLLCVFAAARLLGWSLHALQVGLDFTSPDSQIHIPTRFEVIVIGLAVAGLVTYVIGDRIRDVYVAPRMWALSLVRGWALRLLGLALVLGTLLIGLPMGLQALYDAGVRNQPTVAVAKVIHALGFTTAAGCRNANEGSYSDARDAALLARDTTTNPTPVSTFTYGACGTSYTGRTDGTTPRAVAAVDSGRTQGTTVLGLLAAIVGLVKSMTGRVGAPRGEAGAGGAGRLAKLTGMLRRAVAPWLGSVIAVGLIVVFGLRVAEDAMIGGVSVRGAVAVGLCLVALTLLKLVTDANRTSLHPFYRERLASAFAIRRQADGTAAQIPYDVPLAFSKLVEPGPGTAPDSGPELVVCAIANVEDEGAVPPGRGGLPFVFTRTMTGIPQTGLLGPEPFHRQAPTKAFERYAGRRLLTLPAAVAISGAAVSPVMGRMTRRPVRLLLALANVRLGVWLPNPTRVPVRVAPETECGPAARVLRAVRHQWNQPGLRCLLWEINGRNRIDRPFLYVTDGGHYDNLGLVEALRRRATTVYVFDGSGDPPDTWRAFGQAVSLARADLGVEITLPGDPPLRDEHGLVPTAVLTATATYPDGLTATIYLGKLGVPLTASWDVRAYAGQDPAFPLKSTADQLYGDLEFESYRRIGELAGDVMVDEATTPKPHARIDLDAAKAQAQAQAQALAQTHAAGFDPATV